MIPTGSLEQRETIRRTRGQGWRNGVIARTNPGEARAGDWPDVSGRMEARDPQPRRGETHMHAKASPTRERRGGVPEA